MQNWVVPEREMVEDPFAARADLPVRLGCSLVQTVPQAVEAAAGRELLPVAIDVFVKVDPIRVTITS